MDAYDILGIPANTAIDVAKQAYRRLASVNHPDKGGSKEKFQQIQAAWEQIERGYLRPPPKQSSRFSSAFDSMRNHGGSSINDPGDSWRSTASTYPPGAHNSYDPRSNKPFGSTDSFYDAFKKDFQQAKNGAIQINVPATPKGKDFKFTLNGEEYSIEGGLPHGWVGSAEPTGVSNMPGNPYPARGAGSIRVQISLIVKHDQAMEIRGLNNDSNDTRFYFSSGFGDAITTVQTNAINLITGAWITIKDVYGKEQTVRIPAGFDPDRRLRVGGSGHHRWDMDTRKVLDVRGDIILQIKPIFTTSMDMSETEFENAKATFNQEKK